MKKIFFLTIFCCFVSFLKAGNRLELDTIPPPKAPERIIDIYDRAEVMPSFPGGSLELMKYLQDSIQYPISALQEKLEGKVVIKFYVDVDGFVKEPVVLKNGIGSEDCAKEAIRVIRLMPKWLPGMKDGKPVRVYYVMPITFKLQ